MQMHRKITGNEEGFILVIGMTILVVLTLLGMAAMRNTVIDLKIAGNERELAEKFYVADSTWQVGGLWLNHKATAPEVVNAAPLSGDDIVRNYGDGGNGVFNDTFTANQDGSFLNIPYWYRVIYRGDAPALKYGAGYRDFRMEVQTSAEGTVGVSTRMYKVYKIGY